LTVSRSEPHEQTISVSHLDNPNSIWLDFIVSVIVYFPNASQVNATSRCSQGITTFDPSRIPSRKVGVGCKDVRDQTRKVRFR